MAAGCGLLPTSVGRGFSESLAEVVRRRTARVSALHRHLSKTKINNYDYVRLYQLPFSENCSFHSVLRAQQKIFMSGQLRIIITAW
jgi:hypothetical protein